MYIKNLYIFFWEKMKTSILSIEFLSFHVFTEFSDSCIRVLILKIIYFILVLK